MGSTTVPFLSDQSAQPQTQARRRRLSTLWWRYTLLYIHSTITQRMAQASADERDTPAVGLPQLTLSVRLCDYAECRKPLHTVLQCAKCKGVAYCSKDCQMCSPQHPACALSRPLAQEIGKCTSAQHGAYTRTLSFSLLPKISFATHRTHKHSRM